MSVRSPIGGRSIALSCALLFVAVCGGVRAEANEENPAQQAATEASASDAPRKKGGLPAALTPQISSALEPKNIAIGETSKLTIEVMADATVQVSLPEQSFGGLELSDRALHTEPRDGRVLTRYELELLAFEEGSVEIPALTLRFVGPDGELDEGRTEPHTLEVSSLIANEPNAEPKPATAPVVVEQDDYTLAWVFGGLLAAAAVALLTLYAARWWKQREKTQPPPPPPRPPWELAFDKLQALARDKELLLREQRGEEFVDGVSDALREYLGRRYGFDGLERTTGEILSTLETLRPDKLSLSGVSLLLEQCDLVKFARATPAPEQCDDLFNGALGLVRATIPGPTPAAPPEGTKGTEVGA